MSRRRPFAATLAGCALVTVFSAPGFAAGLGGRTPGLHDPAVQASGRRYLPGVVVVKLALRLPQEGAGKATGSPAVDAVMARHRTRKVENVAPVERLLARRGGDGLARIYISRYADGADAVDVARELAAQPGVEYAEPHYVYALDVVPNDPSYSTQAAYYSKMQFPGAWDVTQGGSGGAVIAICDGGTLWNHADLAANVWNNPGETPGDSLDNDGNGFVDDVHGWNFSTDANDPTGLAQTPASADHGTHVAGIACAVANNAVGIAGASFNAKFMPICTADPTQDNAIAYGYEGILYAAMNGADVVNCSWGGQGGASSFEQDIIDFAWTNGTTVVAAAGNGTSQAEFYPAAYRHVTAVANVKSDDVFFSSTNYGTWVDLSAQGFDILSTSRTGDYVKKTGTSMASPHVAAACALVKTRWPGYTPDQVAERVRVTSEDIDALNPSRAGLLGHGRLNAFRALTKNTPAVHITTWSFTESDGDGVVEPGETLSVHLEVTNELASCTGLQFKLRENSTYITMLDSTAALAALDSLQTSPLATFRAGVALDAPIQHEVLFTLAITATSPAYTDKDRIRITVLPVFATHDANLVHCSITSVGKLGFALGGTGRDGIGFRYNGSQNYLYEGALLIGTGRTTISDGARTTGAAQDDDFQTVPGGTPHVREPWPPWAEYGVASFTDALAASPLQIEVRQESYESTRPADDDFIILKYRIRNDRGAALDSIYAGWFCDWDLDAASYATNATGFDAARGLLYAYDTGTGPDDYVGVRVLTAPGTTSARGIWNDGSAGAWGIYDGYSDAEKWQTLTGGIVAGSAGPADVSTGIATGPLPALAPHVLAAGDSMIVAFAFVGGANLAALQANSDAALALWSAITTDAGEITEPAAPRRMALRQNAPNPFNPSTRIAYELPFAAQVQVRIYRADGRLVRTLVDALQAAGLHQLIWDGRDQRGRMQASGTYFYRFSAAGRTLVRKMQLVR